MWSRVGFLNSSRYGHNAIAMEDGQFLVIGGYGAFQTEKCQMDTKGKMSCTEQTPTLSKYQYWPELLRVESDFCGFS